MKKSVISSVLYIVSFYPFCSFGAVVDITLDFQCQVEAEAIVQEFDDPFPGEVLAQDSDIQNGNNYAQANAQATYEIVEPYKLLTTIASSTIENTTLGDGTQILRFLGYGSVTDLQGEANMRGDISQGNLLIGTSELFQAGMPVELTIKLDLVVEGGGNHSDFKLKRGEEVLASWFEDLLPLVNSGESFFVPVFAGETLTFDFEQHTWAGYLVPINDAYYEWIYSFNTVPEPCTFFFILMGSAILLKRRSI